MDKYREQPEALARGNFFTDFSHLDLNKKYSSSELLKFLRTKANVSDLLEANAQLIELIFRLASEEGNANFEVEDARGVFDTLGIRLDAGDAQLAQKTDKGNVSIQDINKNTGKFDETYFSDEFNQKLNGGVALDVTNVADRSLTANKLAYHAVSPHETDFISTSSNLIDLTKALENKLISGTGEITTSNGHLLTDYIRIDPNVDYFVAGVVSIAFFDESKNFIKRSYNGTVDDNYSFIQKYDAHFVRANVVKNLTHMARINRGGDRGFEPYYQKLNEDIALKKVDKGDIMENAVTAKETSFVQQSNNLVGVTNLEKGLNIVSGQEEYNETVSSTGFIPLELDSQISFKDIMRLSYYDYSNQFIQADQYPEGEVYTRTPPEKARFLRASVRNEYVNTAQLNMGDSLKAYDTYFKSYLEPDLIKEQSIGDLKLADDVKKNIYRNIAYATPITKSPKPMLVISYDDNPTTDYDLAFPVHQQYGVPGEINVIVDFLTGRMESYRDFDYNSMSIEQVKELEENGWEISSHTKTHLSVGDNNLYKPTMAGENKWYVGDESRWDITFPYEAVVYHRETEPLEETLIITGKGVDPDGSRYLTSENPAQYTHNRLHDSTFRLSDHQLYDEVVGSVEELKKLGFNARGIAYPYNASNLKTRELVKKHLVSGRSGGRGYSGLNNSTEKFLATQQLTSYGESTAWTQSRIDDMLDEIVENNGLGIIFEHSWTPHFSVNGLDYIIRTALEKGIEITTRSKALEHHANRIEVGDPFRTQRLYVPQEKTFIINAHGKEFDNPQISELTD